MDSRDLDEASIRRRRECETCGTRFTTYERIEAPRLVVVKRDGSRQEFDREKLVSGFRKALTRRPLPEDAAEHAADQIEAQLRSGGATEVDSSEIGKMAMDKLRALDGWQTRLRAEAARRATLRASAATPVQCLWQALLEILCRLGAGALAGLLGGYDSHIALDAFTPASLPLLA